MVGVPAQLGMLYVPVELAVILITQPPPSGTAKGPKLGQEQPEHGVYETATERPAASSPKSPWQLGLLLQPAIAMVILRINKSTSVFILSPFGYFLLFTSSLLR